MKVVVLGGGIAGLCMGIYLHQNDFEVSVNEQQVFSAVGGHAFLMHHDGISVLRELAGEDNRDLPGKLVDTFILKDPSGSIMAEQPLKDWQCFKRTDLLKCLTQLLPEEKQKNKRVFTNFIYKNDRIVAAEFLNGEMEYGDIFIGADGANSIVRKQVFGEIRFEPGRVKEVIGIVQHEELARSLKGRFTKFQGGDKGLAFGMIPTSEKEVVWFMQYDPLLGDVAEGNHELLKQHCSNMLQDFPAAVKAVLAANDFKTSYIWNTRDLDLLPIFHHQNVVLIGDAAHVALPFTSAGTTNAMMDAKVLLNCLQTYPDYSSAFTAYYKNRAPGILEHLHLGRALRNAFLNPSATFSLPLISDRQPT